MQALCTFGQLYGIAHYRLLRIVLGLTLQSGSCPSKRVEYHSLTLEQIPDILHSNVVPVVGVFGKHVLKFLRNEAPFTIICAAIASMLVFVNALEVDAEKGIGEVAGNCRIRKAGMDNKDGKPAEQDIEAQSAEASVCIQRPDNAVFILYTCKQRALGTEGRLHLPT